VKLRSFEFNLRELAGSLGDFGTLFPLAIGYTAVCGLDPAGFLVMMGAANIATGLLYRLPVPVQPMKVLAVMAIAQHWSPSQVYAAAAGMGIVWMLLALTGVMRWVARATPAPVVRGIQVALGLLLAIAAVKLLATGWWLGLAAVAIVLLLRQSRIAPAAVVLMVLGAAIMLGTGRFQGIPAPAFRLPPLTSFHPDQTWEAMLRAGFAQIPVTATNAIIATAALAGTYWPDGKVTERKLAFSTGVMNLVAPFFGGMPMCHGAGGLAGQYYFGARTGGAKLIEGGIEMGAGLFLASSIAGLFAAFPQPIMGAMLLLVGMELVKFGREIRWGWDLVPLVATVTVALLTNMAYGFLAGLAVHHAARFVLSKVRARRSQPL
jgi:predicted benzoate:H+ symporter BenE